MTWDAFRRGFNHVDHRNIGIATRDAVFPAVRDHLYYAEHQEEGLAARQVNEMLLAGAEDPDYFVDISPFIDKKVDAMLCHRSQVATQDRDEMMKRQREGRFGQRPMVESFKRVHLGRPPRPQQPAAEAPAAVHEERAPAGATS
jgi:LmbE family N-acetylglucosaminyl deacetylase